MCPACASVDTDRCNYCLTHRLDTVPRLQLEKLGGLLLEAEPAISARELLDVVARYGRAEEYARATNARLGWAHFDPKRLCSRHVAERDDWLDTFASLRAELDALRGHADNELAALALADARAGRIAELEAAAAARRAPRPSARRPRATPTPSALRRAKTRNPRRPAGRRPRPAGALARDETA